MGLSAWAENLPIIATIGGVGVLLFLILRVRMNAFVALLIAALISGLGAGMAPDLVFSTITKGMGGTLGFIAIVIGLGALFGTILQASGALESLAAACLKRERGDRGVWMMGGLGLLAAIPVFFDVALFILAPLVFAMAKKAARPALYYGLPLLAGLATAHAFIPPTPGPLAIAELLDADLGWMILFGCITGAISVAVAGPLFVKFLNNREMIPASPLPAAEFAAPAPGRGHGALKACAVMVLPLLLIMVGTLAKYQFADGWIGQTLIFIGHPFTALLLACGAAIILFRAKDDASREALNAGLAKALEPTGAIILITGAGGAFKQVLVDTGAGAQIAQIVTGFGLTPLFAGFALAMIVRVAQGSATVAMITAAGLTAPIVQLAGISAPQTALVAIAIAAGATGLSHVNDSGFWLVSRLFNLSEAETLRTWTLSTLLVAVTGCTVAALLYMVV